MTGFVTSLKITTSLVEAVQIPFEIVHLKVADALITVTADVGLVNEVTAAEPETTVQAPAPILGAFAASVVVVPQIV